MMLTHESQNRMALMLPKEAMSVPEVESCREEASCTRSVTELKKLGVDAPANCQAEDPEDELSFRCDYYDFHAQHVAGTEEERRTFLLLPDGTEVPAHVRGIGEVAFMETYARIYGLVMAVLRRRGFAPAESCVAKTVWTTLGEAHREERGLQMRAVVERLLADKLIATWTEALSSLDNGGEWQGCVRGGTSAHRGLSTPKSHRG